MEYSKLTLEITSRISKDEKKAGGIFITPRSIIAALMDRLQLGFIPRRILEPSAGTGEIANYARARYPDAHIDAVEINPTIFEAIKRVCPPYNYLCADFTTWTPTESYDLVVGNPPFVVCGKTAVPEPYRAHMVGRPNLFVIFILHSVSLLKVVGILAFVVPASFLNAAYYAKIRNHMKALGTLLSIDEYSDGGFLETQQLTIGLVFRKDREDSDESHEKNLDTLLSDGCAYSLCFNGDFIFSPNVALLRNLFTGATTLARMGIRVRTGTVVWNERKSDLTHDATKTLLIYNTNITKEHQVTETTFKNGEKKQYIDQEGSTDPVIVVNRGNGNSAYKLSYAMVDGRTPYLVENHLNIIECRTHAPQILASLANEKTQQFVALFLGNNGLSKTELETIFPIYL
jgi:type I restriction-modification system DNA methylase subunit